MLLIIRLNNLAPQILFSMNLFEAAKSIHRYGRLDLFHLLAGFENENTFLRTDSDYKFDKECRMNSSSS